MQDLIPDAAAHFALPPDRVWLSASHQGPLPNVAATAVQKMVMWKQQPHHLATPQVFTEVPEALRTALGEVISAPADEIVLANSSSYGLHLVANGLELGPGDEVIVAANDFPSDILPWVRLEKFGVTVHQIQPAGQVATPDEIAAAVTPRTRAVCLTWVHSLSGQIVDLDGIGEICREADALFVVNASQGVGAIPFSPADHPVDAVVGVGFKYLCGPYGTGFCWLDERALDRIEPTKLYWLSALTADDLAAPSLDLSDINVTGARAHDIFGTANYFNFAALTASVKLIIGTSVTRIYAHNLALAAHLVDGIDRDLYEVGDRGNPERRSAMIFLRPTTRSVDETADLLDGDGITVARRAGMIRIAPHFYNTIDDIDRALDVLNA